MEPQTSPGRLHWPYCPRTMDMVDGMFDYTTPVRNASVVNCNSKTIEMVILILVPVYIGNDVKLY